LVVAAVVLICAGAFGIFKTYNRSQRIVVVLKNEDFKLGLVGPRSKMTLPQLFGFFQGSVRPYPASDSSAQGDSPRTRVYTAGKKDPLKKECVRRASEIEAQNPQSQRAPSRPCVII